LSPAGHATDPGTSRRSKKKSFSASTFSRLSLPPSASKLAFQLPSKPISAGNAKSNTCSSTGIACDAPATVTVSVAS